MQIRVQTGSLQRAILERHEDGIGFVIRKVRVAGRAAICGRRDEGRLEGMVVRGDTHYTVRLAVGADAVDAVGGDITVVIKPTVVANSAAAILDGIFLAVDLDIAGGTPHRGGQ